MKQTQTSYEELPVTLTADMVARVLGISRAGAYELMHTRGFPTLRIGKRLVVAKDQFIKWINTNSGVTP